MRGASPHHTLNMKNSRSLLSSIALSSVALPCAFALWAEASDHIDFPKESQVAGAIGDPVSDISDLHAFSSPTTPGNLVVSMNVNSLATESTRFSDQVTYSFRLRPAVIDGDSFELAEEHRIDCRFNAEIEQTMTCVFDDYREVTTSFNDEGGGDDIGRKPIKAFAGLRRDPFFLDIVGVRATLIPEGDARDAFRTANGIPDLKSTLVMPIEGAQNSMAPLNVLSIVLEFSPSDVFGVESALFAVVAETSKKGLVAR
jgi:hypothetical protein